MGYEPQAYTAALQKRDKLSAIKSHLLKEKTFKWLLDNAEISTGGNIFTKIFKR